MFCEGGSLLSIEDPSEQEFIQNNLMIYKDSKSSFWIGLYKTHKGTFTIIYVYMLRNIQLQNSTSTIYMAEN